MITRCDTDLRLRLSISEALTQFRAKDGGADRNRTCDLLIANETLYQLSYDPIQQREL